jgi:hypothetical protein
VPFEYIAGDGNSDEGERHLEDGESDCRIELPGPEKSEKRNADGDRPSENTEKKLHFP